MDYKLNFTRRSIKDLSKIPNPFYDNIKNEIIKLEQNPRPNNSKKLKIDKGWSLRVGDYRVIYQIFDETIEIDLIRVGHRKDIYKN